MEKEMLVVENMALVGYVVKKYIPTGYEYEDLLQEGMVGLVQAAKVYDPSRKIKFSTLAVPCIHNSILQFLRREDKNKICGTSLDEKIDEANGDTCFSEIIGYEQKELEHLEELIAINQVVSEFSKKEREIFYLHYVCKIKQRDIAPRYNTSQANVSRILKSMCRRIQREVDK